MAADYVQTELLKREIEREQRWRVFFGSKDDLDPTFDAPQLMAALPESDDEIIARSMLGRR